LEFDQAKFKQQLDDNPGAVSALFAERDGVDGIAGRTLDRLEGFLSSNGSLSNRTDGLNKTLSDIQDQRDQLELRIASYEERLINQFSAADSLIAQIQSTGNFVSQQLAAIAPRSNQD
jgi:flagellar hook-associated protein 2